MQTFSVNVRDELPLERAFLLAGYFGWYEFLALLGSGFPPLYIDTNHNDVELLGVMLILYNGQ
jgi:hypothetical protein